MKKIGLILVALITLVSFISVAESNKASSTIIKNNYINFALPEFGLKMQLPDTSSTAKYYFGNQEVLFSTFFNDQKLNYWGYIQIWKIRDLNEFLQNSKSHSRFQFTSYNQKAIEVNNLNGTEIDWSAIMRNEREIEAKEIFMRKPESDEFLVVTFTSEGKEFTSNLVQTFDYIISSIKWK